jgi:hypothetical protein
MTLKVIKIQHHFQIIILAGNKSQIMAALKNVQHTYVMKIGNQYYVNPKFNPFLNITFKIFKAHFHIKTE